MDETRGAFRSDQVNCDVVDWARQVVGYELETRLERIEHIIEDVHVVYVAVCCDGWDGGE